MNWISVKDRMPLDSFNVLVFATDSRDRGVGIAYFLDSLWWGRLEFNESIPQIDLFYSEGGITSLSSLDVTHWMSLPEAPELKEKLHKKLANLHNEYPKGSMWQDESSRGEDGLVDIYVMNDVWEFLLRAQGINFISN